MNTTEQIGEYGIITADGLRVRVRIIDARKVFGRNEVKITPADGSGERWVQAGKVEKE
jgi:hypothetical protein